MSAARHRLAGWAFVFAAASLAGTGAVLSTVWRGWGFAAAIAAVATVVAAVWTKRATARMDRLDQRGLALPRLLLLDKRGRVPLVCDMGDPVLLGVHPAAAGSGATPGQVPAFVVRDATEALQRKLQHDQFVLIVGESTAGKSRLAYEAMRALFGEYRLIAPSSREAVQVAVETAVESTRCVLWLDDLERFIGAGGLNGADVARVLGATGGQRTILATMRAEEYAKLSRRGSAGPDSVLPDALRQGRDVLRAATRIDLPRRWSREELARADRHRDDPRVRRALAHADRFGIGEYLAAGPQLLADWLDGWAPGTHPRGSAMVLAAVHARHAGIHRPLSVRVLERLHEPYLRERGDELLRPESTDAAIAWATTPLHATSSLLLPHGDATFLAFDYLIDAIDKHPIPAHALDHLISFATPGEAMEIGELAWAWHRLDQAEAAFRHAEEGGLWKGHQRRCHLARTENGHPAGLRIAQERLAECERGLGPDHPDTLRARENVAWETHFGGQHEAALHLFQQLNADAAEWLAGNNRQTINMRIGQAECLRKMGDFAKARTLFAGLVADCAQVVDEDDRWRRFPQIAFAQCTAEMGDPEEAIRLIDQLLSDMDPGTQDRDNDHLRGIRYERNRLLDQAGRHAEALPEWRRLLFEQTAAEGPLSLRTLGIRRDLADSVGGSGDPAGAVEQIQKVLADASELFPAESFNMIIWRRSLAHWTGEAGDPREAARQLQHLAELCASKLGTEDGYTLGIQRRQACWTGRAGDAREAVQRLEELTAIATRAFGESSEVTRVCRVDLSHWRSSTTPEAPPP